MGFWVIGASSLADVNLLLQIIMLTAILFSRGFAKNMRLRDHGVLMSVLVGLNIISFILIMGPTMLNISGSVFTNLRSIGSIITLIHAFTGGTALILGFSLAVGWRFSKSFKPCAGRRNIMLITIWLWGVSTLSGIMFYIYYYI